MSKHSSFQKKVLKYIGKEKVLKYIGKGGEK